MGEGRPIGFSTGAIAPGDVRRALAMLEGSGARAVELSALRLAELGPLLDAIPSLDLSAYEHVSVHAPSRFSRDDEPRVADALASRVPPSWPVVLHPDTIHDLAMWRPLGARLFIENMDKRKATGRTAGELSRVLDALPEAAFCFDVGHAHQIDRTMLDAWEILSLLGARVGQVHLSEVTAAGRHDPVSRSAARAFRKIAAEVPEDAAIIVESPALALGIAAELAFAAEALDARRT
jgi:hypothetical protein